MRLAVLSGKGGTGKTSVSTNLAALFPRSTLIDCDVEEPNAQLFLKPVETQVKVVEKGFPRILEDKCSHCRRCSDFCRYHALLASSRITVVMKELCHDCGGCALVCPENAIVYDKRRIGTIVSGRSIAGGMMSYGEMDEGEYSGVRIIHELKDNPPPGEDLIIDCPPGSACSAVAALEGADFALIVTEPTPFALSDMKMVVAMVGEMGIPAGVVVNKAGIGNNEVYGYCRDNDLPVLGKIPFSLDAARCYARGGLSSAAVNGFKELYLDIWTSIKERAR